MESVLPGTGINVACSGKQFHGPWNCNEPIVLEEVLQNRTNTMSNALLDGHHRLCGLSLDWSKVKVLSIPGCPRIGNAGLSLLAGYPGIVMVQFSRDHAR